jgi:hypothetical protein
VEEIEAIIAKCGTTGTSPVGFALTPGAAEFLRTDEALCMVLAATDSMPGDPNYAADTARKDKANAEVSAVARRIWAQPGDVVACAYVANAYCGYPWDLAAIPRGAVFSVQLVGASAARLQSATCPVGGTSMQMLMLLAGIEALFLVLWSARFATTSSFSRRSSDASSTWPWR